MVGWAKAVGGTPTIPASGVIPSHLVLGCVDLLHSFSSREMTLRYKHMPMKKDCKSAA